MKIVKNLILSFLVIIILAGGSLLPKKAEAFLGFADTAVVIDPAHIGTNVAGWAEQWARFGLEQALKVLLQQLKRRLLDTLTDQTTAWIRGEGEPKFVTDFGQTLADSAQAAVGDTLLNLGLGELCQPIKFKVQMALQNKTFSRRVSCTLNQVVDNLDAFYNDFSQGGWLGYQEIWKPQNNIWGAIFLANDERLKQQSDKEEAKKQEIQSGQGFVSVKRALEWTLVYRSDGSPLPEDPSLIDHNPLLPGNPGFSNGAAPPVDQSAGVHLDGLAAIHLTPDEVEWRRTKDENTTPGTAIAGGLQKSLYSDFDFIINAQDISDIVGAILDAAINRLIKSGVEGVQGMLASQTKKPRTYDAADTNGLPTDLKNASTNYDKGKNSLLEQMRASYLRQIDEVFNILLDASSTFDQASATNEATIKLIARRTPTDRNESLLDCFDARAKSTVSAENIFNTASVTTRNEIKIAKAGLAPLFDPVKLVRQTIQNAKTTAEISAVDISLVNNSRNDAIAQSSKATDLLRRLTVIKTDIESQLTACKSGL